jgi:hypothetical protein
VIRHELERLGCLTISKQIKEITLASPLEDLDELILRCRDVRTREYIREAVSSYRVGAFRSAIVGTWIAVCFDLIGKFRELALAGDKEAEKQVHELDALRIYEDLSRALKFEKSLLQTAKEKFELISQLEYIDLARLQEDRNRCAHPPLTVDDKAYTPSAELARLHIHSSVTHLLQHPPLQGKHALDRILDEIGSQYFPTTPKDAKVALASGPLGRPRESLVSNLVRVLVKRYVRDDINWKMQQQLLAVLQATESMHREYYSKALASTLSAVLRAALDVNLDRQLDLLTGLKGSWNFLDLDVQQKIGNYVRELPWTGLDSIGDLLENADLQIAARHRLKKMTLEEVEKVIFFNFSVEISAWMISKYLASKSFDEANRWGKEMMYHTKEFAADDVRKLLIHAARNDQITGSRQLQALVTQFEKTSKLHADEFNQLLNEHGLFVHLL